MLMIAAELTLVVMSLTTPARLTVSGSKLIDPSGKSVRLTGFNWQIGRTGNDPGQLMRQLAPNATVARLVGVLWGNTHPLQHHPNKECMTHTPPNYFNDQCFEDLDPWVKSATDQGLWVILAVRGEYVAGQLYDREPGTVIFRNKTLANMALAMWRHVAAHYASFDRIAAYEILSEPRDKTIDAAKVRDFYESGCQAVQQADPRTPCLVGNAPYYKLWNLGEGALLRNNPPAGVIYTFDYFNPPAFVSGSGGGDGELSSAVMSDTELLPSTAPVSQRDFYESQSLGTSAPAPPIPMYGKHYPCHTLYQGFIQVCATWNASYSEEIPFDASWHRHNLQTFAQPLATRHHVPLFMNQFKVNHGVSASAGRYDYVRDLLSVARDLDIGWAWWTWSGGNDHGWAYGSSEIVFHWPNGSTQVDTAMLDTMGPLY